jgi:hypothetical protein
MNSLMVFLPRCSRIACWPSTQASCMAHGAPSPQARSSMMQRATPNGPSTAALFGLDETRVGELGQDASEQAAGNVGFGGDPVGGHPLTDPGKIHQSPQGVPPFATQLQLQTRRLLWREYLAAPIERCPLMRTSLPRAASSTTRSVMICEE